MPQVHIEFKWPLDSSAVRLLLLDIVVNIIYSLKCTRVHFSEYIIFMFVFNTQISPYFATPFLCTSNYPWQTVFSRMSLIVEKCSPKN
jgi:hypothetical protein